MLVLWLAALLFDYIRGVCDVGCLRCTTSNTCVLCDITRGYYLDGFDCIRMSVSNCEIVGLDGMCLECGPGFFLDKAGGGCLSAPVPEPQCQYYSSSASCIGCAQGYSLDLTSGRCTAMADNKLVTNCTVVGSAGRCLRCSGELIPSTDGSACVTVEKCPLYSPVSCSSCRRGYFLNPNFYFSAIRNNQPSMLFLWASTLGGTPPALVGQASCEPSGVENCAVLTSASRCGKCIEGYNLQELSGLCYPATSRVCDSGFYWDRLALDCLPRPAPQIRYCVAYSSAGICSRCTAGHLVAASGVSCVTASPPANCQALDPTASVARCARCSSAYFVSDGQCSLRSVAILNCLSYVITADSCAVCASGTSLAFNGAACVPQMPHCLARTTATVTATSNGITGLFRVAVCTSCEDRYRLTLQSTHLGSACTLGMKSNCLVYDPSPTDFTCTQCEAGYYLSAGFCMAHTAIDRCSQFSATVANTCISCQKGFELFDFQSKISTSAVANCAVYSSPGVCGTCNSGFYRQSSTSCIAIVPTNCLATANNIACTSCASGYFLLKGVCQPQHDFAKLNCAADVKVTAVDGYNLTCAECARGSLPIDATYSVCLASTALAETQRDNCVLQRGDGACIYCVATYLVSGGACIKQTDCTGGYIPWRVESVDGGFAVTGRGVCSTTDTTCATSLVDGNGSIGCVKCVGTRLAQIDDDLGGFLVGPDSVETPLAPSDFPKVTLCDSTTAITNCLYAQKDGTILKCVRCQMGFAGTAANVSPFTSGPSRIQISACASVNNCDNTVVFRNLPRWINRLFSCHQCTSSLSPVVHVVFGTRYVYRKTKPSTECVTLTAPNKITNCQLHAYNYTTQDTTDTPRLFCAACKSGFFSAGSGSACVPISDCAGGTWADMCETCAAGFAWPAAPSSPPDFRACVDSSKFPNCRVVLTATNGRVAQKCLICSAGMVPDADGYCVTIVSSRCSSPQLIANTTVSAGFIGLLLQSTASAMPGCAQCDSGYVGVSLTHRECLVSSRATGLRVTSRYVMYCDRHGLGATGIPDCRRCEPGFVVISSGLRCLGLAEFPQFAPCASVAVDLSGCASCGDGFVLVDAGCRKMEAEGCVTFVAGSTQCDKCLDGWTKVDGLCRKGLITGCRTYVDGSRTQCSDCDTGLALVSRVDGSTVCYSTPLANCAKVSASAFLTKSLQCTTPVGGYKVDPSTVKSACLSPATITDCVVYAQTPLDAAGSLSCTQCIEGYHVNGGVCLRSTRRAGCSHYSINTNFCIECESAFYLANGECQLRRTTNCASPQPTTDACDNCVTGYYAWQGACLAQNLTHCSQYVSNQNSCVLCSSGYFLKAGGCEPRLFVAGCVDYAVTSNACLSCESRFFLKDAGCIRRTLDSKCASYDPAADRCGVCVSGFYLAADGRCKIFPTGFYNCEEYSTISGCAQCSAGYYLRGLDCLPVLSSPISNCIKFGDSPSNCTRCADSFTLVDGVCVQGSTPNCIGFASDNQCLRCSPGFALSSKGLCVTDSTPHCFSYGADGACELCANGFFLQNKACVQPETADCLGLANGRCVACKGQLAPSGSLCVEPQKKIPYCRVYASPTTCAACVDGYAVMAGRASCTSAFNAFRDPNCADDMIVSTPVCAMCPPGKYLKNGACAVCPSQTGCQACDADDVDKCLLCASGYFMLPDQTCASATTSTSVTQALNS